MDGRDTDIVWMARALELASNGQSGVQPNPMVGCLIVLDGKVISEGFHEVYGGLHAEVNAINSIPSDLNVDLFRATAYVTLEPCSHFGKTPPCADLLIENGIGRVVTAMVDPNPKVRGKGHQKIEDAGIEIRTGVLEKKAEDLNRVFLHNLTSDLPFITLKWAESFDGYMDPEIDAETNRGSFPISSTESRQFVHQLRASHKGILVGRKTVEVDNPRLTTREYKGVNPFRIIIDPELRINHDKLSMHKEEGMTFILCNSKQTTLDSEKIKFIHGLEKGLDKILSQLKENGVHSILVEGGAKTLQTFIDQQLWNEAWVIKSNKSINQGLKAPEISDYMFSVDNIGDDTITQYRMKG